MPAMPALIDRVRGAFTTWPDRRGWARAGFELLWLVPAVLLCGAAGGFIEFGLTDDLRGLVALALVAIFVPALGEEILFRALFLPRRNEVAGIRLATLCSVCAFVLWHPLQTLLFGGAAVPLFIDPWFLAAVAALGIALARIYHATQSLWPCLAAHWAIVVGWKAFFGGPPNPFAGLA